MATADALKQEGNKYFQAQNYEAAIQKYSESIKADGGKNFQLYTNRALARLRLSQWSQVIDDCQTSLALNTKKNIKGYYFLSMAQLEVRPAQAREALANGLLAYELCVQLNDKSIKNVVEQILNCKKAVWAEKERPRLEAKTRILNHVTNLMQEALDSKLSKIRSGTPESQMEGEALQKEYDEQIKLLSESLTRRPEVPSWLIDDISFACMHDPVMTKNGRSYERATIMEHLRYNKIDPVTRDPLYEADLRSNHALAQACDEFLQENGWAVDY